ncbi:MAG: putative oxidoreductase, aryl-alcohol dehydrogenase like protein [Candidatus Eremiobacteraeota bacterium]|nr:putative oxidoreductase, aryl-alcohol dehydrogenase like protein [Candidatus Eremiobacteraeota bacterium]
MNYQLLGRSGLRVSDLCLGTMTFGEDWGWGAGKDEARRIYDAYRSAGGNFIDTANVYTGGTSETFVAEFIAGHREEVVLATKYSQATGANGDPNAGGNQRKNMVRAVEASLKRLGTDYIDLYWLHMWDALTPAEEVMRAFDDLVRAGKVLYVGISDAPAWVVAKSNTLADLRGWTPYIGLQIEYSLLERTVERELLPMAADFGLSVLAWSPLRNGVLSGKYLPENANGSVNGRMDSPMMKGFGFGDEDPAADAVVRETVAVASELGVSGAQVALAWLRTRPAAVIPIVGARKLTQFEDNLRSLTVVLSSEQRERLDRVSAVSLGFPYHYYKRDSVRAMLFGGMRERIHA